MPRRVTEGDQRFAQFGWLWQRTKRLADLLNHPRILAGALDLAEGLDRYCEANEIAKNRVTVGDAVFVRGLDYIELPLVIQ
jgi:hypothetical protein